jgi:putative transposase
VTKTATVSLHGNVYAVDAALVGRRVEVVFDPFDLTELQVRYQGRAIGTAVPHRISRHVHPDAGPEPTHAQAAPATGIDYLRLVADRHTAALTERVHYARLPNDTAEPVSADGDAALEAELSSFADLHHTLTAEQIPGQLDLTTLIDTTDGDTTDGTQELA